MIRRTIGSLSLSIIFMAAFYSAANAQTSTYIADTGVIDLAPGQSLRISAAANGSEQITVRLKKIEYLENGSTNGLAPKHVGSQTTSGPIVLEGDQCLVFYLGGTGSSVRVQLLSGSQNLKANAFIVSPASGGSSILPMEQVSFNFTNITYERY